MSIYEKIKKPPKKHGTPCILNMIWKAYKSTVVELLWKHFFGYIILSYIGQALYQFGISAVHQEIGKTIRDLIEIVTLNELVVIIIVIFFMSKMVDRVKETYRLVTFPDDLLILISSNITGYTRLRRTFRSNITRNVLAAYTLALTNVSYSVKKKFPDLSAMVNADILTTYEASCLKEIESGRAMYRQPLDWAATMVSRGRSDNLLTPQAADMLVKRLADQADRLSQMLSHEQMDAPARYTTAFSILVFFYNVSSFVVHVIPDKHNLAEPLTFVLNPLPSALLYACYHGIIRVASIISRPLKLKRDYMGIDKMIDDQIEGAKECFLKMLAERRDYQREQWYDNALADEMRRDEENESQLYADAEELYGHIREHLTQEPAEGQNMSRICHPVLVHSPVVANDASVHIVQEPVVANGASVHIEQERVRSRQQTLLLGLKQRQIELQEIERKFKQLRNANRQTEGMHTGNVVQPQNVETNNHYEEIEAVHRSQKRVSKTNPAIRCGMCYKFVMTDNQVRELEEKNNGVDDVRKYKRLQCKCTRTAEVFV